MRLWHRNMFSFLFFFLTVPQGTVLRGRKYSSPVFRSVCLYMWPGHTRPFEPWEARVTLCFKISTRDIITELREEGVKSSYCITVSRTGTNLT